MARQIAEKSIQSGTLGPALRDARKAKKYTQEELAEAARLSRTTVRGLERGQGWLTSFRKALGVLGLEVAGRNLPGSDTLGQQLALLRKRRGLSQASLAVMLGVDRDTVGRIEAVDERCRLETLDRVMTVLGAGVYLAPRGGRRAFFSHAATSSTHHGWTTPPEILDRLYAVIGTFDLDPCSPTADRRRTPVRARMRYTVADDGLALAWHGRVFMNPPYGRELKLWLKKARDEVDADRAELVVALIPARTDARWWHEHVAGRADVFLLRGRLYFGRGGRAPFPSALVVYGASREQATAIADAFPDSWHIPLTTRE